MSPTTTAISVSSETFLPFPAREVWPHVPEAADAPEAPLAREEGRLLRWRHSGTRGWLPVEDPTAEIRLAAEADGTRLSLRLEALSAPEVSGLVRERLEGFAEGLVAACAGSVRRAAGRRRALAGVRQ